MEQERFTVGELAALAGVSPRTIRYYDKKGLLCPVAYSENQYRQYDKSSLLQLQQVLMLKYIGFSLEEIRAEKNASGEKTAAGSGHLRGGKDPGILPQ